MNSITRVGVARFGRDCIRQVDRNRTVLQITHRTTALRSLEFTLYACNDHSVSLEQSSCTENNSVVNPEYYDCDVPQSGGTFRLFKHRAGGTDLRD